MSKKKKLTLIIISAILLVILCAVIVLIAVANSQNDDSVPTRDLSQWMSMIKDETLLKTVVIPGAHDAGTIGLPYILETQDRTIAELLNCGTRYFDLRVSKTKKGELKIYHGLAKGVTLDCVIEQISQFLSENPSETLILDFQHFENGAEEGTKEKVLSLPLVKSSGDFIEFIDNLTVGEIRGKCLVFWGPDSADGEVFLRRNNGEGTIEKSALHSYYESRLNEKSSSAFIKTALPRYIDQYRQKNSGLFVLQGQLTDGLALRGPRLREVTHNENMNDFVRSLQTSPDLDVINVIMRDYVSPYKNCLTLQLNLSKDTVKSEKIAAFKAMIDDNTRP